MKKGLFTIKVKYDGVPILSKDCKDTTEMDDAMKTIKKKFGY